MKVSLNELQSAHLDWQAAQKALDEAQGEFVDVAILTLAAAERRYGLLLKMAKEGGIYAQRQAG